MTSTAKVCYIPGKRGDQNKSDNEWFMPKPINEQIKRQVMAEMGARGGIASAKARMVKLTPEQRLEISRKANEAKKRYAAERKAAAKKETNGATDKKRAS